MIDITTNINNSIQILKEEINDPTKELPENIFLFISSIMPLINVDILIKNEKNQVLLSWRNDLYTEQGWHIIGGIIRFKENILVRAYKTIEKEIGQKVILNEYPIEWNEIIEDHFERDNIRSHFISFLYEGFLDSSIKLFTEKLSNDYNGYLKWFDYCPNNLISCHKKIYAKYFKEKNK